MRHGANQFAVLDNRTSAHSLNDAAGQGKQFRIRNFDDQSSVDIPLFHMKLHNFNIIIFRLPGHGTDNLRRTGYHFLFQANRNR